MLSFKISQEGATEVTEEVQDDLQWIKRMANVLNGCQEKTLGNWPCTIFKVPENIRQCDNKGAYDPSIVTIGPYHYNKFKNRTVQAMQAHKWHCMRRLLSRHTKSRRKATDLFGQCLEEMRKMDADVRGSYSEDLHHLSVNDLALIMFLDGCFIIHVLLKFNEVDEYWENISNMVTLGKNNDNDDGQEEEEDIAAGHEEDMVVLDIMGEKKIDLRVVGVWNIWGNMLHDLVNVENQIPFTIIQALFSKLKTPGDEDIDLVEIARQLLSCIHPSPYQNFATIPPPPVHHLLHLFHSTFVPSDDCLKINSSNLQKQKIIDVDWIPSATELQLAGVKFVKKKGCATNFLDISFKNGIIEIPQVELDDNTNTLFRNLIAFEQCYYPHTKNYITAYAFFMDYMINAPKDVELFELKGIFINRLGTPDHAATLINHLCDQIRLSRDNFLKGSIQGVKNYHESRWHKWRAKLMRDYFDNPWAIVSLVAALILLLLTIQQSFIAAYSYFHPPKN
ncbi:UPF0481 protein At3g47200-like [Dioscorea cayenensis subsp. rotundata]|uniref:UPF0481 protein At3g47200-like n=1 Tax=Dioscorea cayennensis subsp. rotundata TaxID=55577 RepID=A0AB40CII5_DIOCR|nr:UPF0481 protein At3g47200-like [Dioscorea cayenensis subsp. rotundata]